MKSRIEMSQHERDVPKVMCAVLEGERAQREASEAASCVSEPLAGATYLARLKHERNGGVVHRLRARRSSRRLSEKLREQVLAVYH